MRIVAPKGTEIEFIGHRVKNVSGNWYINGGTFCCRCSVAFDFDESLKIYLDDKRKGRKHGIPRCPHCGQSLRTRSKPQPRSGFWDRIEKIHAEIKLWDEVE